MPRTSTRPAASKKAKSRKPRKAPAKKKSAPSPTVAARRLGKSLSRLARDGLSALSGPIELARSTVSRAKKAARKKQSG